ncbi:carboxypeptidase 4 [Blastomyces gilchristii SLH14081]|uniref:Carboxypeptidase n=1 Tax=Blastomyces gilchristii (strain SLH14081) TaxID=559298 RepID=A0A179U5Z4_BLAGS|nr:carboxypeptidase 4 [Blastomyces gilchristii SLH14081]OAT03426.1 carboxypeptidase 4 [Blastomyces gilchristii SLH14081]
MLVFLLNGENIPDVPFDIGEAYAGLLPISSDPQESRKLYFWFMPSSDPLAVDEVTIWLNGGPGCSSLEGLFQENGPFIHQYGTFAPVRNMWSWTNLTNMIWVEQPVGTGFTQGSPNITNQEELAAQFLDFFKNFLDIFGLHRKKIYLTGESYAGKYIPYIADAMFKENDTKYFDVQGTLIYDPSINVDEIMVSATTCPVLWDPLGFPGSFQYVPDGAQIYFNRSDVQQAINAPLTSWSECSRGSDPVFINGTDTSPPPSYSVLPSVIEQSKRTIIAHGDLDFILMAQGTLLTIQNMTWHGSQGFTAEPTDPLFVPYHTGDPVSSLAGAGVMGKHRTERGLTYAELFLTGHMGPQYSPAASYRLVEYLLGRIDDLSS